MRRLRFILATALACSAVIGGACSTFSGTDEPRATGVDASSDSNGGGSDGGGGDAPSSADGDGGADATPACKDGMPVFEDDFSSGGTSKWTATPSGCTTFNLNVTSAAGDTYATISCESSMALAFHVLGANELIPVRRRMDITFRFRLGKSEPHTFAQLVGVFGTDGDNLRFGFDGSGVELRRTGPSGSLTSFGPVSTGTFHTVILELDAKDADHKAFDVRAQLDGESKTFTLSRDGDGGFTSFALQLGVFATNGGGAFEDSYGNVRVWSCD